MSRAEDIAARVAELTDEINHLAREAGRDPEEILLLAVTKQRSLEEIDAVLAAGIEHIGESKVQEAESKLPYITSTVTRHMVGHLQTNKVHRVLNLFEVIESVDSFHLARELDRRASDEGIDLDVYIEINSSGEPQKNGVEPEEFWDLADAIIELPTLHLEGMMTIGPLTDNPKDIRESFDMTRDLFEQAVNRGYPLHVLSMGMSDDYALAIAAGATELRLGKAIFAAR